MSGCIVGKVEMFRRRRRRRRRRKTTEGMHYHQLDRNKNYV
jgi:hypothetical protein